MPCGRSGGRRRRRPNYRTDGRIGLLPVGVSEASARQGDLQGRGAQAARGAARRAARAASRARGFPVLILITGVDGAGKGEVIQRLYEWLDPRHLQHQRLRRARRGGARAAADVALLARPAAQGRDRRRLRLLVQRPARARSCCGEIDEAAFERELERIERFERMLADEGALILKFCWSSRPRQQKQAARRRSAKDAGRGRHVLEEWLARQSKKRARAQPCRWRDGHPPDQHRPMRPGS